MPLPCLHSQLAGMISRNPCPIQLADSYGMVSKGEGEGKAAIARVAALEVTLVDEFGARSNSKIDPEEMLKLLTDLCQEYWRLVEIGYAEFVQSGEFNGLLDTIGAYAEGVKDLIDQAALAKISDQMIDPGTEMVPLQTANITTDRWRRLSQAKGHIAKGKDTSIAPVDSLLTPVELVHRSHARRAATRSGAMPVTV